MHLGHFIICTSRTRFIALGLVPPNGSATNGQQLAHHLTHPLRPSSYSSKQVIRKVPWEMMVVVMVMMVVMMVVTMMVVMMMVMVMMVVIAEKTAERKCKCISWRMGQLKRDI